jgi:pimeloyl-ACP methyl ester carboxylesterase
MAIIESKPTEAVRRDWEYGHSHKDSVAFQQMMLDDWPAFADMFVGVLFHELPVSAKEREAMVAGVASMPAEACYEVTRDAHNQDLRDVLSNIKVPTILLHGRHGRTNDHVRDLMLEKIPSVRLVTFENSGHAPFLEEAGKFNDAVRDFASSIS